jgi:hypothetical protein
MEYAAFIFGIFGVMAYMQVSSLKGRIDEMEERMQSMSDCLYFINNDESRFTQQKRQSQNQMPPSWK